MILSGLFMLAPTYYIIKLTPAALKVEYRPQVSVFHSPRLEASEAELPATARKSGTPA